jgi:hypothetical protein
VPGRQSRPSFLRFKYQRSAGHPERSIYAQDALALEVSELVIVQEKVDQATVVILGGQATRQDSLKAPVRAEPHPTFRESCSFSFSCSSSIFCPSPVKSGSWGFMSYGR